MPGPPPPPPPSFNLGGGSADQSRGALLQSIRAGKPLKKTVTNDKSAPSIGGKIITNNNHPVHNNNPPPVGLGGLFAGGMPKLKPVGLRQNNNMQPTSNPTTTTNTTTNAPAVAARRGPPPVPPPAAQKPIIWTPTYIGQDATMKLPVTPKLPSQPPNIKPSPPPKKLNLSNSNVSRAQSMRLPRSPPVLAPTPPSLHQSQEVLNNEPQQRPATRVLRAPSVRPPSPPVTRNQNGVAAAATRVAPPPPPCRPPLSQPPPPPVLPHPPPPPLPHRGTQTLVPNTTTSVAPVPHSRQAPLVPSALATPPTPPLRNQSLRTNNCQQPQQQLQQHLVSTVQVQANPAEFEARFVDLFHSIANFPAPERFRGIPKVYNSKTVAAAKQQAPAPPMRSVSNAGSSSYSGSSGAGKSWQKHNNATAC